MVNKVILIGRAGRDSELRETPGGHAVANVSIATTETWTKDGEKQEKTTWHRLIAWNRLAEVFGQYVTKGTLVYVEGKLDNREWEDKDGAKQRTTEVVVSHMRLLGGGKRDRDERRDDPGPDEPRGGHTPDGDIPF